MKKKVCMLGSFAVGKTSLIRRFVHSIFSDTYLTTIGVKIDKKTIIVDDQTLDLMLWDVQGENEFDEVRPSYFHGASGYFLVVDGTRRDTLDVAHILRERVMAVIGQAPFIFLFNKSDIRDEWEITDEECEHLSSMGWDVLLTSARSGAGVEEAFLSLGRKMLDV